MQVCLFVCVCVQVFVYIQLPPLLLPHSQLFQASSSLDHTYDTLYYFHAGFKKTVKRGVFMIINFISLANSISYFTSGERVTLTDLQRFPTPVGTINILQRVGPDYKPLLGNILLKSHDGQRIRGIEMTNSNNVDLVVYDMFQKWCTEDEECTWRALVLHLNEANLRSLASDIESALI